MSLNISQEEIYNILSKKKFFIDRKILAKYLVYTRDNFLRFSKEITNDFGKESHINPLLWQVGHVVFFYLNLIVKNIKVFHSIEINNLKKYIQFYDSFLTPLNNRKGELLIPYYLLINYYNEICNMLIIYLNNDEYQFTNKESYLIMLGILHNEMHNEAFIFTKLSIDNQIAFDLSNNISNNIINSLEFINYDSNDFIQGSLDDKDYLIFDNEMPRFKTYVNKFKISKYPITEHMYLSFIKNGGYLKDEYWCRNGLIWRKTNNIELPLYWLQNNGCYYKKINSKLIGVDTNLPIIHISYYEAKAFCKWMGVRLPTETEYEYVATNMGKTKFPWGDKTPNDNLCNLNYKNYIKPVNYYKNGDNNNKISQLIGNIWEWCEESIYPYNGFKIDPVYREMSYPFFGFKKICKGGCFAVPDFLIHPRYRNAQYPDCRIQFIGFRVCKD